MDELLKEFRGEEHISHARLYCYMQCPLKYRFAYVDKFEPAFIPSALSFGSAIHQAIARFYRETLEKRERPSLDDVRSFLSELWETKNSSENVRYRGKDSKESMLELGLKMLEVFYANLGDAEVVGVEEAFSVPLINPADGETLSVPLVGVIDLVERDEKGITVVDIKTASRKYSESRADGDLQLSIYGYAVTMNGLSDRDDVLLRYDVLTKTKTPELIRYYAVRDSEDHARLFYLVKEVLKGMEREVFFPNPDYYCCDCGFNANCAMGKFHQ